MITSEEFGKIIPRKTVIKADTEDKGIVDLLVKFFACNSENYDGYWVVCTDDFSNPNPSTINSTDYNIYINQIIEIVKFE